MAHWKRQKHISIVNIKDRMMNTCDSNRWDMKDETTKKMLFQKNLRSFLTYNVVIFIMMILGLGGAFLWKISVVWGAVLAFRGYKLFEEDDTKPPRGDSHSREQYGRPRRPEWRDKDLV